LSLILNSVEGISILLSSKAFLYNMGADIFKLNQCTCILLPTKLYLQKECWTHRLYMWYLTFYTRVLAEIEILHPYNCTRFFFTESIVLLFYTYSCTQSILQYLYRVYTDITNYFKIRYTFVLVWFLIGRS